MKRTYRTLGPALVLALTAASSAFGDDLILHAVQYPEGKKVDVGFATTLFGAGAELRGKVEYQKGQSWITLEAENLSPAVLHGGEVSSYVLWALTRSGAVENLGELWVSKGDIKTRYTAGLKELALLVTAEAHPLVDRPSELVVFRSLAVDRRGAASTPFSFRDFAPAPAHDKASIAEIEYTGDKPLSLIQAERVLDLARERGAESRAAQLYHDAEVTLGQSRNLTSASKDELALDYARRSLALSSEALRLLERRREAADLEARILERREDVRELESERQELERQVTELETEKAVLEAGYQALERDKRALEREKSTLELEKRELEAHAERLRNTSVRLQGDKEALEKSLQEALAEIADTRSTARGLIVTLPDILFDVDRASLRPEARTTLAKLAGVLQLVPDVALEIEGHTDSTGSDAHNLDLSRRRAETVQGFLAAEGVSRDRMSASGFGEERPVAANDTAEGRKLNRRVEVILPRRGGGSRAGAAVVASSEEAEP